MTPGANGIFDGVPAAGDDQVTSFDLTSLGALDPEGIAFNSNNDDLTGDGFVDENYLAEFALQYGELCS